MAKVVFLIPARNEADSLPAVDRSPAPLTARRRDPCRGRWSNRRDRRDTGGAWRGVFEVVRAPGRWQRHQGRPRHADRKGFDIVVRVDGDGRSGRRDRPDRANLRNATDAAVGSRFGGAAGYRTPPGIRRAGQRVASAWVSAASGVRVTDATSGFWAFGARAIRLLADEHPTGYPEPELLLLLARSGLTVAEVPIG